MIEHFPKSEVNKAVEHAKEVWPKEACGAIINGQYVSFDNVADSDSLAIINDVSFYYHYIKGNVECFIHSHDDYPHASALDMSSQMELDIPYGVISLKHRNLQQVFFWGDELEREPLFSRPTFVSGVYDCYALARDYYRALTRDILPDYPRSFEWWEDPKVRLFEDNVGNGKSGFEWIEINKVKAGDLLMYSLGHRQTMNHCAIYLGNTILHHFINKPSIIRPITYMRSCLRKAARYVG